MAVEGGKTLKTKDLGGMADSRSFRAIEVWRDGTAAGADKYASAHACTPRQITARCKIAFPNSRFDL